MKFGAKATHKINRKLNPFVVSCETSLSQDPSPKRSMPSNRTRGLDLLRPLSLDRFVSKIMSHPSKISDHKLNKNQDHIHNKRINTQQSVTNDETQKNSTQVRLRRTSAINPFFGTQTSVQIDCNTVGPVPTALGYVSRTLIHSNAHVPDSSTDHASAHPISPEEIHTHFEGNAFLTTTDTVKLSHRPPILLVAT